MVLFISYIMFLRESTRWQMIRGKSVDAKETLKLIAKMNKLSITAKELSDISDDDLRTDFDIVVQKEKEKMKDIIASKEIMLRLTVTSFCYFTSSFMYYGLAVHAVLLPGNKYTNFILSSLTSFPGDFLAFFMFKKYGRRISLQGAYICSAIFLIAQSYCPNCEYYATLCFICQFFSTY